MWMFSPHRVKRRRHFTSSVNVQDSYFYPRLTDVYTTWEIRRRRGSWDTHCWCILTTDTAGMWIKTCLMHRYENTLPGDWRLVWKRLITLGRKYTQDGMFGQHRCRLGGIWDDERRLEAKHFPFLSVECDKVVPGGREHQNVVFLSPGAGVYWCRWQLFQYRRSKWPRGVVVWCVWAARWCRWCVQDVKRPPEASVVCSSADSSCKELNHSLSVCIWTLSIHYCIIMYNY